MEEKKEEEPVLQAFGRCKNLSAVPPFSLPPAITNFQRRSVEESFLTDHEYFDAILACEVARAMTHRLRTNLAETVYVTKSDGFAMQNPAMFTNGQKLVDMMAVLTQDLDSKRERMLKDMQCPPVVEEFLTKMGASYVESQVFRHVLVAASGLLPRSKDDFSRFSKEAKNGGGRQNPYALAPQSESPTGVSVAEIHDMFANQVSLSELLALTSVSSSWVREKIYERVSKPSGTMSAMTDDTILSFIGADITVSQYQEIPSKTLTDALAENERFQKTATGKAVCEIAQQQGEQLDERPEVPLEDEEDYDLFAHAPLAEALSALAPVAEDGREVSIKDRVFKAMAAAQEQGDGTEPPITSASSATDATSEDNATSSDLEFGPYKSNLEYLEDQIRLMDKDIALNKARSDMNSDEEDSPLHAKSLNYNRRMDGMSKDDIKLEKRNQAEKIEIKLKKLRDRIGTRLRATKKQRNYTPRLEQLCDALGLDKFEKYVILDLVRKQVMPFHYGADQDYDGLPPGCVGTYIERFAYKLEDKMHSRKYFYKSSTLIKEGVLSLSHTDFKTDLTMCNVDLDRRMFDFLIGLDTEFSELVDGSHLYTPDVSLEDVILPTDMKDRICNSVMNFAKVKEEFRHLEIDRKISYGLGQVLLFYGASGTGKTMLANALAASLKKKVLLVNFPSLGSASDEVIKFLFREARINNALLFFDECEALFLSRDKGGYMVNLLLTELERFDDICILATNRPCDLDEAMYRRVTLATEFKKPDHILRERIWGTLRPPKLPLSDDVDFGELARRFELTGGFIKNAWVNSLSIMVQEGHSNVTQEDLVKVASEQVVERLSLDEFDRRVVATCGIEAVVVSPQVKRSLQNIVDFSKAQSVMFGQWGFGKVHRAPNGVSALFCGAPGTGKTMSAEAIGFDLGCPLMVINVAELMSKYVGETGKNIQAVFDEAKANDCVLVFDEAEGLFGKRGEGGGSAADRHDTINVGILLQYIENYSGVCIVVTNQMGSIDEAFFRRFRHVVSFEQPDLEQRELLWKSIVPEQCPLAEDVSLKVLAQKYDMAGGGIKSALFRAATRAALRPKENERLVSMKDLEESCQEELNKMGSGKEENGMYS